MLELVELDMELFPVVQELYTLVELGKWQQVVVVDKFLLTQLYGQIILLSSGLHDLDNGLCLTDDISH